MLRACQVVQTFKRLSSLLPLLRLRARSTMDSMTPPVDDHLLLEPLLVLLGHLHEGLSLPGRNEVPDERTRRHLAVAHLVQMVLRVAQDPHLERVEVE